MTHETLDEKALNEYSPVVLAYVGDAVFELMVRSHIVLTGKKRVRDIHLDTVEHVKASSQARFVRSILEELSESEKDLVRRGRNTKGQAPRNVDVGDYRLSTGFEALLGYLYLKGSIERLEYIVAKALEEPEMETNREGHPAWEEEQK